MCSEYLDFFVGYFNFTTPFLTEYERKTQIRYGCLADDNVHKTLLRCESGTFFNLNNKRR